MNKKTYDLYAFRDPVFHLLCGQIDSDYTTMLRLDILPKLEVGPLIRLRELKTLMIVDYFCAPISSTAIAGYLRFDRGTVSRATKVLKSEGFITSFSNPEDKRSPLLQITEKGKAFAENYRQLIRDYFERLTSEAGETFTKEESQTALRVLMALRRRSEQFVEMRENA